MTANVSCPSILFANVSMPSSCFCSPTSTARARLTLVSRVEATNCLEACYQMLPFVAIVDMATHVCTTSSVTCVCGHETACSQYPLMILPMLSFALISACVFCSGSAYGNLNLDHLIGLILGGQPSPFGRTDILGGSTSLALNDTFASHAAPLVGHTV